MILTAIPPSINQSFHPSISPPTHTSLPPSIHLLHPYLYKCPPHTPPLPWYVQGSSASKCVSPAMGSVPGKKACARVPPRPSKGYPSLCSERRKDTLMSPSPWSRYSKVRGVAALQAWKACTRRVATRSSRREEAEG